jgi:ubiquinone/menaquinone biosynthesis C-methylase UbiE
MDMQDIFLNNMEKYNDPELYDLQYENYMSDFPLLLEWAKRQGGPIVDLACGTGRTAIPLAEQGFEIIGVDLNEGMLNRAKEKAKTKKLRIEWILQDCTKLSLHTTCPFMYMTGNSFQHFLTNESQDQLLKSAHRHLDENGIFIFGTRFPKLSELLYKEESTQIYIDARNRKVTERTTEEYNPLTQILLCTSTREILNDQGEITSVERDSIALRYVFPKEMERLLQQNGFTILHVYGSWNKDPLGEASNEMIYVCKKVTSYGPSVF